MCLFTILQVITYLIRVLFPVVVVIVHTEIAKNVAFSTSQHFLMSSLQVCIFACLLLVALFCKFVFSSLRHDHGISYVQEFELLTTVELAMPEDESEQRKILRFNIVEMHSIGICMWFTVLVFEFTLLSLHCFVLGFCVAHFGLLPHIHHNNAVHKVAYTVVFAACLLIVVLLFVSKYTAIIVMYRQFSYKLLLHVLCFVAGVFWCLQKNSSEMYVVCKQSLLTCFLQSLSHVLILHDRLSFDYITSKSLMFYIFVVAPFIKVLLIGLLLLSIRRQKTLELLVSLSTALVVQNSINNPIDLLSTCLLITVLGVNMLCLAALLLTTFKTQT